MFKKKFVIILGMLFTSSILFSCGTQTSRISNVQQVIESRAQEKVTVPEGVISNGSNLKQTKKKEQKPLKVDLDLTTLSTVVADANLRILQENKDEYKGLVVKAKGEYEYYKDPNTNKEYYNCIFASSCCPNGLEFILTDTSKYPKETGEFITVVGEFNYYDEDGVIYYNLINASIL